MHACWLGGMGTVFGTLMLGIPARLSSNIINIISKHARSFCLACLQAAALQAVCLISYPPPPSIPPSIPPCMFLCICAFVGCLGPRPVSCLAALHLHSPQPFYFMLHSSSSLHASLTPASFTHLTLSPHHTCYYYYFFTVKSENFSPLSLQDGNLVNYPSKLHLLGSLVV